MHDVLLRLNLSIAKLKGQCYGGAASMAGRKSGVATQLLREEPRAVFTHCYGHSLNLACSDAVKESTPMRNVLDTVQEITKLVKLSPCRNAIFQQLKKGLSEKSSVIRILCPT